MPQPDCRPSPARPPLEPRLQKRYHQLVQEHLQISQSVAAGLNALPGTATSFASTPAAWRFYRNANVSLPALAQPRIEQGRAALQATDAEYALVMHDWSHLNYDRHTRKADRCGLAREHRQGYELQSALLVSDRDGTPLAPLYQNLESAAGLHTTRAPDVLPAATHLDELRTRWAHLEQLALGRPLVQIVDREGDSIGHYRQWQAHAFLVRAKGGQRVAWEGQSLLLSGVASELKPQLVFCREVAWHDRPARQYVGETRVVLTRPARQKRRGQKPRAVAGEPVTLRLIVSEVRSRERPRAGAVAVVEQRPGDGGRRAAGGTLAAGERGGGGAATVGGECSAGVGVAIGAGGESGGGGTADGAGAVERAADPTRARVDDPSVVGRRVGAAGDVGTARALRPVSPASTGRNFFQSSWEKMTSTWVDANGPIRGALD